MIVLFLNNKHWMPAVACLLLHACCYMPAVVEMKCNDGPPKDVTFEGDLLSPGPESKN